MRQQINVFYVGADGKVYNWIRDGKKWANKVLGVGEPAALGTGLAAYWNPDGKQANVFYVGANGKVYNWTGTAPRGPTPRSATARPPAARHRPGRILRPRTGTGSTSSTSGPTVT